MSKPTFLSVCPDEFPGFYESRLSFITDCELERYCENRAEDMTSAEWYPETYQPEELRLTADEIGAFAWEFVDYRKIEDRISRDWVDFYVRHVSDAVGFKITATFETLDSPREYNFTTDRVFFKVALSTVRALFALSKREGHKALRALVEERFTSRDGFASFYPSDLDEWLEKPVAEWDHNELGTLFTAIGTMYGEDFAESATSDCEEASGSNGDYIDDGLNWTKLDAKIADEIENKRHDLPEDHPLFVGKTFFPCREHLTFNFGSEG